MVVRIVLKGNFKQDLEKMLDGYCESLTDTEFQWLVDGLNEKLKQYFENLIHDLFK